jgi:hypothetical protein
VLAESRTTSGSTGIQSRQGIEWFRHLQGEEATGIQIVAAAKRRDLLHRPQDELDIVQTFRLNWVSRRFTVMAEPAVC